jgi:hypothetical protein
MLGQKRCWVLETTIENYYYYYYFSIWNHGNYSKLLFYNTYECEETQIKNPFDQILGIGFIKNLWKWKLGSLKNDIFTKDFQRTHIIQVSWW